MKKRLLPNGMIVLLAMATLLALPGQTSQVSASLPAHAGSQPAAVLADPADWPMYGHDYQRTNFNPSETTIGAGNVGQLVQRWQANVGTGSTATSAAPSISNGVVYVGSSASSGNNFFAFNATSGTPVWQENIGYRNECFNVGIGSTPAISGTQVVVGADNVNGNAAYVGIDTVSGTNVWTNLMNVGSSGFPWESPFLYNNRAYVGISSNCDNPSVRGELRAVDMTSGNTVASAFFVGSGERGGGIWNSPALTPDGSIVAVGSGEDYSCTDCSLTRSMVTMDSNTLAILQHHQEPSPNNDLDFGTTAIIFHDSQNRTLVAAGHKNNIFYTYDITNVNSGAIWTHSAGGTNVGLMPAYDPTFGSGGTLFIVNSSIYAVDPANGNLRWGPITIGSSHGNIAIANGLIFVNLGSSGLRILDETNGSTLRTLPPNNPGSANSGVAVSHGFIYWLSGSYVNAWSLPPSGTPSATDTALVATSTSTPTFTHTPTVPPTNTSTSTPTRTSTATVTTPASSTRTSTAIATATTPASPTHTVTPVPTGTFSRTPTPGSSGTGTSTATSTPTCTASPPPPTTTPPGTIPPCWSQNSRLLYEGFDNGTLDEFVSSVVLTDTGGWTPVPVAVTCYTDYAAFAPDPDSVSDQRLTLINPLNIPSFSTGSFLVFSHNYSFDQSGGTNNDGGVLELSTDNGTTWFDAGPYITSGGYNGTITRTGATCGSIIPPFSDGQSAWVGTGEGDVDVNLQPFIGQSLRFRFRLGSDCSVGSTGWYVDNVSVSYTYLYNCTPTVTGTPTTAPTQTPGGPTADVRLDKRTQTRQYLRADKHLYRDLHARNPYRHANSLHAHFL